MATPSTPSLIDAVNQLSRTLRKDVLPILGRLPSYGRLTLALATHPRISLADRAALLLALGYQVSPIDAIPGVIPIVGQLDDVLVMLWGIQRTLNALPPETAEVVLASANLTREQVDADAVTVRRALRETLARGLRVAGHGASTLVRVGLTAAAFAGYFAYYTIRGTRQRQRA